MSKIEKVIHGDALNALKTFESNSIDSVCCDPPYGLSKEPDINEVLTKWLAGEDYDHGHGGFMGKSWDSFVPHPDIWREVYRVLKPGGHALVFAGTRTQDLMTISLRLAGFEVRDVIQHIFFSGFPKGHNVSKTLERRGNLDLAIKYEGFNTNLKPAHEPIIMVRKPLHDGRKMTVADCVEKYGTGAINIDASRIAGESWGTRTNSPETKQVYGEYGFIKTQASEQGRFPANCITLDSDQFYSKYFNVANDAVPNISPAELSKKASKKDRNSDWQGEEIALEAVETESITVGSLYCVDCDVILGGSKRSECYSKGHSLEERKHVKEPTANTHPTVKPTDLMAWLVRLVTPAGGTVLDPFAGSGSTLVAAKREGFGFIGVELTEEYIPIIEARTGVEAEANEGQAKE